VDYIADKTAAEERIRMYARFRIYTQISVNLVSNRLPLCHVQADSYGILLQHLFLCYTVVYSR